MSRGLKENLSPGTVLTARNYRPRLWKKGPAAARRGKNPPRARILTGYPATVCFLFDTAFLWETQSELPDTKNAPFPVLSPYGSKKNAFQDKIRVAGSVSRRAACF